jgi:hypothetical protein
VGQFKIDIAEATGNAPAPANSLAQALFFSGANHKSDTVIAGAKP